MSAGVIPQPRPASEATSPHCAASSTASGRRAARSARLSPSSEGDDDGDERRDFQSLESLLAYVLVAQDGRRIRVYTREPDGRWPAEARSYRDSDAFDLPSLTRSISVSEIYDDILDSGGRSLLR